MELAAILVKSLWAGLFASVMGVLLTAPPRYVGPAFLCGFAGRLARDVLMSWGLTQNWSTAVAAAVVVLVAVAFIRGRELFPVVLISGVLPLGAAVAMFNAIVELMKVSTLEGEALSGSSVALNANIGKLFTTSLAIAVGLAAGIAIVQLITHGKVGEEV